MAEGFILRGDLLPQVPAAAGAQSGVEICGLILRTDGGALDAAAVGDEDQIVFGQVHPLLVLVHEQADGLGLFAALRDLELNVRDLGVVMEPDAVPFQIADHGQDHRLVLVVFGEPKRPEIRKPADMVDIALEVELHLQGAVPVFKGEHGAPVEPEVRGKHLIVEHIGDALFVQLLVRGEEELHDLHAALVRQAEPAVGVGVLPLLFRHAAERVIRVLFVQPIILIQHAHAIGLDGRDGAQQIPHHLEMVVHLPPAAHHIADAGVLITVACAAGDGPFFKDVDMFALHLAVPHQIARRSQRGQPGADEVGRLAVYVFWFQRTRKCFVVTTGIIHVIPSVCCGFVGYSLR